VPADLNGIVEEVVVLLRRTIDPRIQINTRLKAGLGPVRGDPAQLNQVLMNLCLNARDAIDGAGRIGIETAEVTAAELPAGHGLDPQAGAFVRLTVTDSGCGMTDEVRDRMFEPFFTTKDVGKGTGLGLAMVFAAVRQHQGWITCRSEVRRGTRFDIFLPRAEAAQPKAAPTIQTGPARVGRETVLIADDEDAVRRLAAATLRRKGYVVLEATDGQQAVDAYRRDGDRIDLVILDLTMPVLSGQEAFRHLLRLNPRVRVVFASGYAAEHLTDLEKELMAGFVSKPYRPGELLTAVEEAIQVQSPVGAELIGCET
jgi:CheY-like chemotaxis protein